MVRLWITTKQTPPHPSEPGIFHVSCIVWGKCQYRTFAMQLKNTLVAGDIKWQMEWQQKCQGIASGLLAATVDWNLWKIRQICVIFFFFFNRLCLRTDQQKCFFFSPPPQAVRHGGTRLRADLWNHAGGWGLHRRTGAGEEVYHTLHIVQGAAVQTGTSCHILTKPYWVALQSRMTDNMLFFVDFCDTEVPHESWFHRLGEAFFFFGCMHEYE